MLTGGWGPFAALLVAAALAVGCSSSNVHKVPDPGPITLPDGGDDAARLTVAGSRLLDPDGKQVILRGYNWGAFQTAQEGDAADNRAQGANVARIPCSFYFDGTGDGVQTSPQDAYEPGAPGHIDPILLDVLDQQIAWATAQDLWVIVMVRGGDDDFWTNPVAIPQFVEMWSFLAKRYRTVPHIAAYELLSEPHPPAEIGNDGVAAFYEKVIAAVRAEDARTPVIVGAAKDYEIRDLEQVFLPKQKDVIYTANFYELPAYVKQAKKTDELTGYPGRYVDQGKSTDACDTANAGKTVTMNKAWLQGLLGCATKFRDAHDVPIFVNQVGVRSATPDSKQYVDDVLDLFHANDVGFTYWTYRSPFTHEGLGSGDIGVLYQTEDQVWHRKADWLDLVGVYLKGGTNG